MADIRFSCPRCGQHAVGDEALVGMSVECPTCSYHFTVTREMITSPPSSALAEPTGKEFVLIQSGAQPKTAKEGGGCCFGLFVGFVMSTIFFAFDRGHSSYTVYLVVGLIAGAVSLAAMLSRK